MAVGRPKAELVLSAEEHAQVSALAAARSLPHAIVARAKLVLWAAQGESNFAIAQRSTGSAPNKPGSFFQSKLKSRERKERNCMRTMILVLAATLAAALLAVSPAKASEKTDVIATVKQYMDSFNKGDKDAEIAACAAQASIVDDFPPYVWQGATACADWWNDNEAFGTRL